MPNKRFKILKLVFRYDSNVGGFGAFNVLLIPDNIIRGVNPNNFRPKASAEMGSNRLAKMFLEIFSFMYVLL
jgi:hypothetical protein